MERVPELEQSMSIVPNLEQCRPANDGARHRSKWRCDWWRRHDLRPIDTAVSRAL